MADGMAVPITTLKAAQAIAGTLGYPSKMPGASYGLPARRCPVGSMLVKIKGSVCHGCYALNGNYLYDNVVKSQQKRFESLHDPRWIEAMIFMIERDGSRYFRWHDSGDLQGVWHLDNIVEVARALPKVKFWIPTREQRTVKEWTRLHGAFPKNLMVRMSGAMINGPAPAGYAHTSTVVTAAPSCPASRQDGKCGACRRCWNPAVGNVCEL